MSVRTIEQKMSAGSVWNGALPAGSAVFANDLESFPAGTSGGLFDFANDNPMYLVQVMIRFGAGTTSWTLSLVDADGVEIIVAQAASAAPFIASVYDTLPGGLLVLQAQKLKLVSVGVTTAESRARLSIDQHRG